MKNSSDTIVNRTRDLPVCRAVPQPTALRRDPSQYLTKYIKKIIYNYIQRYELWADQILWGATLCSWVHGLPTPPPHV